MLEGATRQKQQGQRKRRGAEEEKEDREQEGKGKFRSMYTANHRDWSSEFDGTKYHPTLEQFLKQAQLIYRKTVLVQSTLMHSPTDRRVGDESLEQPWLRGMRLRLCPSPVDPASTLWAPVLMVLRVVLVSTRPGEPLRLPASERHRLT